MAKLRQVQAAVFRRGQVLLLEKQNYILKSGRWLKEGKPAWRLPKGKLEKGEGKIQGLKRELGEEAGFDARKLKIGGKVFDYAYEAPKGVFRKVSCYIVTTDEKPRRTREARIEGILRAVLLPPRKALEKLRWAMERKALAKALAHAKAKGHP